MDFSCLWTSRPILWRDVKPISVFPFWPQPGPLFHIFLVWWVGVALYACYLLGLAYRREKGIRKKQFFNLLLASGVAYLGGSTNFPLWYGIEILPYGTICFTFYVALIAYALLRYHLMDFSVFVEKGLSYVAVLLLISQPAYPILLLAQKSVFGAISYRYSLVQLFVHLITVAGAYQMRLGTRGLMTRPILGREDSSLRTLSEFSTNISDLHDMNLLGKEIIDTLGRGMSAQTAMLFVLNGEKNSYVSVSDFGSLYSRSSTFSFAVTDDLPRYLAIVQTRVMRHELKQSLPDQWKQSVIKDLERLKADVCFPFIRKNRLLGFCLIGPCRPGSIEAADVLGFISTLLSEASLALENAILREEVNRSKNTVRHMDRLRSLETMAVGLSQELNNPQASIKAFVQLAQMRKNDEEFLRRFQEVISTDVLRIEQLTKEIREYVIDVSSDNRTRENINDLIESCISFIALNPDYQHVKIEMSLTPGIPSVDCKRQEIRQVIFNLLLYHLHRHEKQETTLHVKSQSIISSTGDQWIQIEFSERPHADSFNGLVPFQQSENLHDYQIQKSDLCDEGVAIAEEIIQAYDGYVQSYGSTEEQPIILLSLPVTKKDPDSHSSHPNGSRTIPSSWLSRDTPLE